jgi:hypothetical protein
MTGPLKAGATMSRRMLHHTDSWPWRLAIVAVACCLLGADAGRRARGNRPRGAAGLPAAVTAAPPAQVMEVAAVDRGRRDAVVAAARRIDDLLATHWRQHGVDPTPRLTDEEFARRAYLDLAGRIPTYDEVTEFLASRTTAKRADLIDTLLESPDSVSHFYNFWADILRLTERPLKTLPFEPYLYYVKDSIRTNKPYDEWVHEMLTADGRLWENPAVGFQVRDFGMPLPYVDNTVRVFLGTQIGCAQCHDHPFDHWTQKQFYELAALTSGTKMRPGPQPGQKKPPAGSRRGEAGMRDPEAIAVRRLVQDVRRETDRPGAVQFVLANATKVTFADRPLALPHDYRYDDGKPLEVVSPQVLWGDVPQSAATADGRARFAAWVVAHDNRQFARTIANRMWRKVMGVGLVEPVDDFRAENPASHPALLEHLTDLMRELDFDLREFVRVVVSTGGYQRRAVTHDPTAAEPFRFPGPALRRMTAEQVWDSILTLVARNPWSVQRPTPERIAAAVSIDIEHADAATVERAFDAYLAEFGPGRYQRSLQQVCGYRGQLLMRASEMPTPLPLGHFLRQFGQSDRESIAGGRTVATIPQILAMFNGPITHAMLQPGSVIFDEVTAHRPDEAIDVVFLSVLSRRPEADERRIAGEEIATADTRSVGCGNLVWGLLNTREFLFIQ